jgi:type II secretory pathway predicted ATPase ExeA
MDYTTRFGLEFNPFIKNAQDIIIETSEYLELKHRLDYLIKNKGFGVITGGSGRGKTTAIRHWAKGLNSSLFRVFYIPLTTLTVSEFYKQLAAEMGLEAKPKKSDNYKLIQDEVNRYAHEKRITPVFIFDEANYISNAILNDLKMFFSFEMDSKDRAVVLLAGLPVLNNNLRMGANEPLRQRIIMNYTLDNLSKIECKKYIDGRLSAANATHTIFEEAAIEAIVNTANGVPRLINKICDSSLFISNHKNLEMVTADIVMQASNEIELD